MSSPDSAALRRFDPGHAILLAALVLAVFTAFLPSGLMRPPAWMVLPFADWINWLFLFVKDDLGFIHVTRAISGLVEWLLDVSANILYGKKDSSREEVIAADSVREGVGFGVVDTVGFAVRVGVGFTGDGDGKISGSSTLPSKFVTKSSLFFRILIV